MYQIKCAGLDVVWDLDLYGRLLETGGGKERMTAYFSVPFTYFTSASIFIHRVLHTSCGETATYHWQCMQDNEDQEPFKSLKVTYSLSTETPSARKKLW